MHQGAAYEGNLRILRHYNCDYLVHGDDIPVSKATGEDVLKELRDIGALKIVKRTEGISTTELVGRILLFDNEENKETAPADAPNLIKESTSSFLASARRIYQFFSDKTLSPTSRIVYIDGGFDLMHMGHIEALKSAKQLGDYLIVGVHDDQTINAYKGKNHPIMKLNERCLNILALKYVDDVIMGAPKTITVDMIKTLNISVVVKGSSALQPENDPYLIPKNLGIYKEIPKIPNLSTDIIIQRVIQNRKNYIERNSRLVKKEIEYYENKTFVSEI